MEQEAKKGGFFDNPIMRTKITSANAKLFPEGVIGYFLGPTLALLANSVLSNYFNKYMSDILDLSTWAGTFFKWLPVISVIFVVIGNIVVGRLMDHNKTRAGKARPLILLAIPLCVLALLTLFVFTPLVGADDEGGTQILALVCIAIGYNLWYAVAYPCYFTSHAALVSLSTRNSKDRSLLATISNATSLAAIGLTSMILPFFLGMLFVNQTSQSVIEQSMNWTFGVDFFNAVDKSGNVLNYFVDVNGNAIIDKAASYNNWKIFVIALMVIQCTGAIAEFFFTRERVTEESFAHGDTNEAKKAEPLAKQFKACVKDKFWWIMIAFFFLYQLGGMLKNVSQLYFCTAMFTQNGNYSTAIGGSFHGTISIVGAIPTALGMVVAWPLSNKIGKGKAIMFGATLSAIGGIIGFINPENFVVVLISFVVKAFGSTPAMYLSLALLADILDHQEAVHGFRTDGLSMTIYGAIMAGMTGLATGILNIVLGACGYSSDVVSNEALRAALPWVFIGGETICYGIMAIIFVFMGVEKFSKFDQKARVIDQKALAEAEGREYIDPIEKMKQAELEAEAASEEARKAELKAKCEKQGLDYEAEEAKYQADQAEKAAKAEAKKQATEKAKAEKAAAAQAAYDALSAEEKAAIEAKKQAKAEKQAEFEKQVLAEFNELRRANGRIELEAE